MELGEGSLVEEAPDDRPDRGEDPRSSDDENALHEPPA